VRLSGGVAYVCNLPSVVKDAVVKKAVLASFAAFGLDAQVLSVRRAPKVHTDADRARFDGIHLSAELVYGVCRAALLPRYVT
jgi:hypothetical protein